MKQKNDLQFIPTIIDWSQSTPILPEGFNPIIEREISLNPHVCEGFFPEGFNPIIDWDSLIRDGGECYIRDGRLDLTRGE